jgi:hypothetical protein
MLFVLLIVRQLGYLRLSICCILMLNNVGNIHILSDHALEMSIAGSYCLIGAHVFLLLPLVFSFSVLSIKDPHA